MPKVIIRPATIKDCKDLARINVRGWQKAYIGQIPNWYLAKLSIEERTKTWETLFTNKKQLQKVYVAMLDEKIVGFCSVGKNRDNDIDKVYIAELWGIYVDPDYYKLGIGSTLMKKGLSFLKRKGYKKATLWVLTTNTKTRMWYGERGWVTEGKTKSEPRKGFVLNETRYIIEL